MEKGSAAFCATTGPYFLHAAWLALQSSSDSQDRSCPPWRLLRLELSPSQLQHITTCWQQALEVCSIAWHLAQAAQVRPAWRVGQLAATAFTLQTLFFPDKGEFCPEADVFPWAGEFQTQLKQALDRWISLLAPRCVLRPEMAETGGELRAPEPWLQGNRATCVSPLAAPMPWNAEQLHWAALALGVFQNRISSPWHLQQAVRAARAQAVEQAPQMRFPGSGLIRLLLHWDHQRRKLLHARRRWKQQLAQAKQQSLLHWAAGAGHMINNPLAVIAGRAQLALNQTSDPHLRQHLLTIWAQAQRAHRMIAGLALYAQMPAPQLQWFSLSELLEELREQYGSWAQGRQVELSFQVPEGFMLHGDRSQWALALGALVDNAVVAAGSHGAVRVWATTFTSQRLENLQLQAGRVRYFASDTLPAEVLSVEPIADKNQPWITAVMVEDTGPGVPESAAQQIFDPFFSGQQAGRGMGMGLCYLWRIVQLHRGEVWIGTRPSRFVLLIPQPLRATAPSQRRDQAHGPGAPHHRANVPWSDPSFCPLRFWPFGHGVARRLGLKQAPPEPQSLGERGRCCPRWWPSPWRS